MKIFGSNLLILGLIIVSVCSFKNLEDQLNDLSKIMNIQTIQTDQITQNTYPLNTNQLKQQEEKATQGFYFSPHAIGKQIQVLQALKTIQPNLKVSKTVYNHSQNIYTIDNFTIDLQYNDGKQKIQILQQQTVTITGGTVFFGYKFNFTIKGSGQKGKNVSGYAHGAVYSDALSYKKTIILTNQGVYEWALAKKNGFTNLSMTSNRMRLKRIEPYDQKDLTVLQQMLDRAFQSITPSNIEIQLLDGFNSLFPRALNQSLNHQSMERIINYTYHHPTKGQLNMTISRVPYGFGIDPIDGYKTFFRTKILGHQDQSTCKNNTVPETHADFNTYGGLQNIQLNCIYQDVVNFIQSKGWLDTNLDSYWQVNAFQFYAGDLYDIMNNLYTKVNPRSILEGQCKASKNNLILKSSRQTFANSFSLTVDYNCSIKTTSKTVQTLEILQFIAQTKFYIQLFADKLHLNFVLKQAQVIGLTFTPVNNFLVTNGNLAYFKANQVIKKYLNSQLFGTGFPTLPRQMPKTRVDQNSTIFYDASAFNSSKILPEFTFM